MSDAKMEEIQKEAESVAENLQDLDEGKKKLVIGFIAAMKSQAASEKEKSA